MKRAMTLFSSLKVLPLLLYISTQTAVDTCAPDAVPTDPQGVCEAKVPRNKKGAGVVLLQRRMNASEGKLTVLSDRSSAMSGPIRWSGSSSMCLDVTDGGNANGNRLQLWGCYTGAPNQQFSLPDGGQGLIQWSANPSKCIDVSDGSATNGNQLQIWDCSSAPTGNHQFLLPAGGTGQLRWASNPQKCLDVQDGRATNGNRIQLWDCQDNNPSQIFVLPAGAASPAPAPAPVSAGPPPPPPVVTAASPASGATGELFGWPISGKSVGRGWCSGSTPGGGWTLKGTCPTPPSSMQLKVLTYNLFWWNLFGQRGGAGGIAGKLIQSNSNPSFDVMGFQECEDVNRVLQDGGLGTYPSIQGPHAICVAWSPKWEKLADGAKEVNEDQPGLYGRRAAMWVRLRNTENKQTLFFINHHGPLPVDTGGLCGGSATAFNLLQIVGLNAYRGDIVVIVGDFNQGPNSETVQSLSQYIDHVYNGVSFGGVDNFLSNCDGSKATAQNLGHGGSDHDALAVMWRL